MKVYVVFRNFDMTEGRGPMVLDKIFLDESKARKYMENQSGVMGVKSGWSKQLPNWCNDHKYEEISVIE